MSSGVVGTFEYVTRTPARAHNSQQEIIVHNKTAEATKKLLKNEVSNAEERKNKRLPRWQVNIKVSMREPLHGRFKKTASGSRVRGFKPGRSRWIFNEC
jgi:hypothetical protein